MRVIMNWRKACDEHGLSQSERSHYNRELLEFIVEKLITWHSIAKGYDYSSAEVNRFANITIQVLTL